jgi:hypothetical protein
MGKTLTSMKIGLDYDQIIIISPLREYCIQNLERFKSEYEKLYRAMKTSHENENKLLKKCKELNTDIIANAAKVNGAIKMT